MIIKNTIRLEWEVEDPVYPYQGVYTYTEEECAAIDLSALRVQQEQQYSAWLNNLKAIEQGQ